MLMHIIMHICLFCSIEQADVHAYTITLCIIKELFNKIKDFFFLNPLLVTKKCQITRLIVKINRLINYRNNH